jgi:hypothetical protein
MMTVLSVSQYITQKQKPTRKYITVIRIMKVKYWTDKKGYNIMKIKIIENNKSTEVEVNTLKEFLTCAIMLSDKIVFDVNTMTMQESE